MVAPLVNRFRPPDRRVDAHKDGQISNLHRLHFQFTDFRPLVSLTGSEVFDAAAESTTTASHVGTMLIGCAMVRCTFDPQSEQRSGAPVARKRTPRNSPRALPTCAVSAPRRPSSRRLEKKIFEFEVEVSGTASETWSGTAHKDSKRRGIAKTAVGAFAQRQHSTAEDGLLEVASSSMLEVSSAASSQPLAGAMVVGMVDADVLPLLGSRRTGRGRGSGHVQSVERRRLVVYSTRRMSVCMKEGCAIYGNCTGHESQYFSW